MDFILAGLLVLVAAQTTYLVSHQWYSTRRVAQAPVFVDTSVLIDGRIVAIAQSGFLSRPLYIPRSVVGELQFLADNADTDKRTRARHGLDIINQLQLLPAITVHIFADGVRAEEGVDNRLLTLAKKHKGALCTIDYNLNKVAVVEGLEVLNVNDLAKTLRMTYLPGEKTTIELTQKGNDAQQGVGHLEDGTMVVVEQGAKYIGRAVEVEFIRGLQTAAGKMMFARAVHAQQARNQASHGGRAPKNNNAIKVAKAPVQKGDRHKSGQAARATAKPRSVRQSQKTHEDTLVELANR